MAKIRILLIIIITCCNFLLPVYSGSVTTEDAFYQYNSYKTNNNYLMVVDFSKPSTEKRLFLYDMRTKKCILSTYVSHGINSGRGIKTTSFSNRNGSEESSLGTYKGLNTFNGHAGYSLRLKGLSNSNSNAYTRAILVHGADYIGNGRTGHSWGCFAVPRKDSIYIINKLKNGGIIYAHD